MVDESPSRFRKKTVYPALDLRIRLPEIFAPEEVSDPVYTVGRVYRPDADAFFICAMEPRKSG
jgi:hypothetical protein